jgi:hypothetical protein
MLAYSKDAIIVNKKNGLLQTVFSFVRYSICKGHNLIQNPLKIKFL